jgi:uncharacterized protein YjaZ
MRFIDPDGKEIWISYTANIGGNDFRQSVQYKDGKLFNVNGSEYKGSNTYIKTVQGQLNSIKSMDASVAKMVGGLESSTLRNNITYNEEDYKINADNNQLSVINGSKEIKTKDGIKLTTGSTTDFNPYAKKDIRGNNQDPRATLAHELSHASDKDNATTKEGTTSTGVDLNEVDAINVENKINNKVGMPQRTTYGDAKIPKELLNK